MLIGMENDSEFVSCSGSKFSIFSRMVRSTRGGFDVKLERMEFPAAERREDENPWSSE